ncbi:KpsF/GutQ family sugar-phosphate isomerase [Pseudooceanicola sp.]|uniref:KpsF/GutQ family sugar-phosphate isomerase n=1 Tax=Pseudooceanicola sp. TaxID=1914328 RepID=UPI0026389E50|nr:KpsF/GutQ family sugar-phosphate isomerase [Pseudooceanicola sp.]MDF1856656.1 KpsF/GutQ family sugar-phosphate isomerase [Pseudooceanicola sp.]
MTDRAAIFLTTARRVIGIEAAALNLLESALDDSFAEAVEVMLNARGRIIVCGMGKSGHIARKIAATLASTGTPAQFVHPAEASHGDLGMVAQGDVALILSNSGETSELADILAHAKRFRIPVIGVAGNASSTLMQQSDVGIVLPEADEACGTGVVPTSSTTMALALGDALAVALMEQRQFTAEHFRAFHPGGKLGAQLRLVRDLMHRGDALPLVAGSAPMSDVLIEISQKGFGVAGVTGPDGRLAGIITDGDLRRHMSGLLDHSAAEVMTADPRFISPDALVQEAVATMNERRITCLFVVDQSQDPGSGQAIGLIHIHDCLRIGLG